MGRGKTPQKPRRGPSGAAKKSSGAAKKSSGAAKKSSGSSHPSCVATVTERFGTRINYKIAHTKPDPFPEAMCNISDLFQERGSWLDEYSDEPRGKFLTLLQIRNDVEQLLESYFREVQDKLPKQPDASGEAYKLAREWCEKFAKRYGVDDPCTSLMGIPEDAGAEYEEAAKRIGLPFIVYGYTPALTSSGNRAIAFHLGVGIGVEEEDVSVNFGVINHEWYYESVGSVSDCEGCTLVGLYPTEVEAEAALAKAVANE